MVRNKKLTGILAIVIKIKNKSVTFGVFLYFLSGETLSTDK